WITNALNGAAAGAGGKQGSSSLPGSSARFGTQNAPQADCSGSSACPAAGLANTNLPRGRAVWRSCAWRAARVGCGPWFASDNAAGNSADTQPCQIRKIGRGTAGYIVGTASKPATTKACRRFCVAHLRGQLAVADVGDAGSVRLYRVAIAHVFHQIETLQAFRNWPT